MTTKAGKKAQEERAKSLRMQISSLKEKNLSGSQPIKNPRDFIAERMIEFEKHALEKIQETESDQTAQNDECSEDTINHKE